MPSLKWTAPVGKPRAFSIFKKITSIGNAGGNDICIEHESLRDYHAQIIFDFPAFRFPSNFNRAPWRSGSGSLQDGLFCRGHYFQGAVGL